MDNIEEKSIEELQEYIAEEFRKAFKGSLGRSRRANIEAMDILSLFLTSIKGVDVEVEQDIIDPFKFYIRTNSLAGIRKKIIVDVSGEIYK